MEVPHGKPMIYAITVLQDRLLSCKLVDWKRISEYFKDVLPEVGSLNVPEGMIERWHRVRAYYLCKTPNISDLDMLSISLPLELAAKVGEYYLAYKNNQTLNAVLQNFYARIGHLYDESLTSNNTNKNY